MRNPHLFLVSTCAGLAAACAIGATSLAPVEGNRAGSVAGFSFFSAVSLAGLALTVASAADGLVAAGTKGQN